MAKGISNLLQCVVNGGCSFMNAQLRSVSLNCLQLNLKKTKATFQCVIAEKKFLKAQNKNAMCST